MAIHMTAGGRHVSRPVLAGAIASLALSFAPLGASVAFGAPAGTVHALRLDQPTDIDGYGAVCTGISGLMRQDPRWAAYPVRLEFARPDASYAADATVAISNAAGKPLVSAHCNGPWLLLKLPAGAYKVQAHLDGPDGQSQGASFLALAKGQTRVILTFPETTPSQP